MVTAALTLNTLPNELIVCILGYIDLESLLELNRTNWHMHDLTLGHIYAVFPGRNPALFLSQIVLPRPSGLGRLANQVKDVSWMLHAPLRRQTPIAATRFNLTSNEQRDIAEAFRSLEIAVPALSPVVGLADLFEADHSNLHDNHWFLEFFLLFLPNVEGLQVYDAWQWNDHTYWFSHAAANSDHFMRLKTITIHGPLRIENIVPLLALPTLRELELWQVTVTRQASDEEFAWESPGRAVPDMLHTVSSSLEVLRLRESYLPTTSLVPIFGAIRSLKAFTYEHVANELTHAPGWNGQMDYDVLSTSLCRHPLETLCVHLAHSHTVNTSLSGLIVPLHHTLKHLDVGTFFQYSYLEIEPCINKLVDILPVGLQRLDISFWVSLDHAPERFVTADFVRRLARAMRGTQLKVLGVKYSRATMATSVRENLVQELEDLGIKLLATEDGRGFDQ
ncbi:hypothetical protein CC86DRAFT_145223 [Ophiobolus disseminans]|uniref:F-box domain-containing protein n=1 Tax=Ophiobolus disseminans TaxID=1469910 RepID=A0A6A6ZF78_9PLEO|nr:hypothetical protein CC86DRAFT_145223 [Ophiobolus disseminans]